MLTAGAQARYCVTNAGSGATFTFSGKAYKCNTYAGACIQVQNGTLTLNSGAIAYNTGTASNYCVTGKSGTVKSGAIVASGGKNLVAAAVSNTSANRTSSTTKSVTFKYQSSLTGLTSKTATLYYLKIT